MDAVGMQVQNECGGLMDALIWDGCGRWMVVCGGMEFDGCSGDAGAE